MVPVFVERPVFIGWIAIVMQIPIQLFFTFWAGGFFGGLTNSFLHVGMSSFIIFGMMAFFGIPSVTFILKKLNYSKTEYKFFVDHLEFDEGFFSRNKKIINYRNISEITLKKDLFQRGYNLGTIYLATLATGSGARYNPFYAFGFGNVSASGVGVQDVYDPDAVYARLRALIDDRRT